MLELIVAVQNKMAEVMSKEDRGATAVEYGLIIALIAAVVAGLVATLGTTISAAFTKTINAF